MSQKTAKVNVSTGIVKPDPIHVKRRDNNSGIKWIIKDKKFAFIYVIFDRFQDDFDRIVIRDNKNGESTLQVDDDIANLGDIKYTLYYIERTKPRKVLIIDPNIKNQ